MDPEYFMYFVLPALGAIATMIVERQGLAKRVAHLEAVEIDRSAREEERPNLSAVMDQAGQNQISIGFNEKRIADLDYRLKLVEAEEIP